MNNIKWILVVAIIFAVAIPGPALMAKSSSDEIEISGEVTFVSSLPDPGKAPYADYLFSAIVKVESSNDKNLVGEKLVVYFTGIKARKMTERGRLKTGNKVTVKIIPYDQVDTDALDFALADEVTDFSLDTYYEVFPQEK